MKTLISATAGLAFALAASSAMAADGQVFVNAGLGQSTYHASVGAVGDNTATATALRAGYVWRGSMDLGVEGGYVDLGKASGSTGLTVLEEGTVKVKGWLLGLNGKYHFADTWYVSARAGFMRDTVDATYRYSDPVTSTYASGSADGTSWYGGVGFGYDFQRGFSLGLNYDNYHAKADTDAGNVSGNIGTYMVTAEYRF